MCYLIGEVFHMSNNFCGTPLYSLQQAHVFHLFWAPELDVTL